MKVCQILKLNKTKGVGNNEGTKKPCENEQLH